MAGVPFIDSYIQQAEPVVDYLTRFSGLSPGDLDPSVSRHHITSMKGAIDAVYAGRDVQRFYVLETLARVPYFSYLLWSR